MKTSMAIGLTCTALVAAVVLAASLRNERDAPQGAAASVEGRVIDCRKPAGRLSASSATRCLIRLDDGSRLELWSPQPFEAGRTVTLSAQRRQHSADIVYSIDEP